MKTIPVMTFDDFAAKYCERQDSEPEFLRDTLLDQKDKFGPDGWMLLECKMLDSSLIGSLVILPYGPNNTYKSPPDHSVSPRGLASDMSVVVGLLLVDALQRKHMGFAELQALIQKRQNYASELERDAKGKSRKAQAIRDRVRRIRAGCEVAAEILGERVSDADKEERIKAVMLSAMLD